MPRQKRAVWGGVCPYCKQTFRGRADGVTMGDHRAPWYPMGGGNRRETCPYSGGTRADAEKRIPPIVRRTQRFIVLVVRRTKDRKLSDRQRAWLIEHDLFEETLRMIDE